MKKTNLLLAASISALLAGCGGGSDSDALTNTDIQITGQLSNISASMSTAVSLPDKLIILADFDRVVEIPVNFDGTFTINEDNMGKGVDSLIIFPVNAANGEIYSNIKIGATTDDSLDSIDPSTLRANLNLGSIDIANNSTANTTVDSSNAFQEDKIDELKALSRNDNALAMFENDIKNRHIQGLVDIVFSDDFANVNNQYSSRFITLSEYQGKRPRFYLDKEEYDGILNVDLYPPSEITRTGGQIMNPTTPNTLVVNTSPQTLTVEADYVSALPEGDWLLKDHSNNEQIGSFSLSAGTPFDDNDIFLGIAPEVNIISDDSGDITSVKVRLYRVFPGGGDSVPPAYFNKLVNLKDEYDGMVFSYLMNGASSTLNFTLDELDYTITDTTEGYIETELSFSAPSGTNINNMNRIIFSYLIGGAKYQFFYQ